MFLNEYLREKYGTKVYKLAFDIKATCPNRDGKVGFGGCCFCSEGGSGDFAVSLNENNVTKRIAEAKEKVSGKVENGKYIAYFQSHTNTYFTNDFTFERFKNLIEKVIINEDIVGISIGTRADCLDDETINYLKSINERKEVWVEIGLQTIHDETRERMNCCFKLTDFEKTYHKLNEAGIKTVVHMIVGLPGESEKDIIETAEYISSLDVFGLKIQLLHVLKNTKLADIYLDERFYVLSMEEYTDLVVKIIKMMPSKTVIHRMTGDGPADILIAPMWSRDKKKVLNMINKKLR